jgi:hypothetical protein
VGLTAAGDAFQPTVSFFFARYAFSDGFDRSLEAFKIPARTAADNAPAIRTSVTLYKQRATKPIEKTADITMAP